MDWSRAKTALIIAFLCLDAFLGWQVWNKTAGAGTTQGRVTAADIRSAKAKLEAAGVRLACDLPRNAPPMPYLVVRPSAGKVTETLARLQAVDDAHGVRLATLLDNGVILYTSEIRPGGKSLRRADAVSAAKSFVERYAGGGADLRLDYAVPSGEAWLVNFCAVFDDRPVFGSHATVKVFPSGVAEARFALLEPVGYSQQRRSILPATEAVVTASSSPGIGARGQSIINVSLGYHSEPYDARQWECVPVWRVLFGDGRPVYVNAHTGEVEKPELVGR